MADFDTEFGILQLPEEILDGILAFASYDEVSRLRLVCKKFDASCQRILNQGFYKVEKFHAQCVRKVKERLPRRESERRKHPLAAHCDILTAIESRLSLLEMTFMKYVEQKQCCFIPGKVLDEMFKVLRLVSSTQVPPRSYELLQELRDISSMAMEHFDENIAPAFRVRRTNPSRLVASAAMGFPGPSSCHCSNHTSHTSSVVHNEIGSLHVNYKQLRNKYSRLKKENLDSKRKMIEYQRRLNELDKIVAEQSAILEEQTNQLNQQETKIRELTQKFADYYKFISGVVLDLKGCYSVYLEEDSSGSELDDEESEDESSDTFEEESSELIEEGSSELTEEKSSELIEEKSSELIEEKVIIELPKDFNNKRQEEESKKLIEQDCRPLIPSSIHEDIDEPINQASSVTLKEKLNPSLIKNELSLNSQEMKTDDDEKSLSEPLSPVYEDKTKVPSRGKRRASFSASPNKRMKK